MNAITISLTACEATPLKHAAMGAARIASEAGNAEMAENLLTRAREYNRTVRQENKRRVQCLVRKAEYVPTPALPVPAVKDMRTVKVAEVQESVRLIAAEMGRMGLLKEWTVIGSANSDGAEFQPLCARLVGKSPRFMEPKSTEQTEAVAVKAAFAEKDELIKKEKARRAARKSARESGEVLPLSKKAKAPAAA